MFRRFVSSCVFVAIATCAIAQDATPPPDLAMLCALQTIQRLDDHVPPADKIASAAYQTCKPELDKFVAQATEGMNADEARGFVDGYLGPMPMVFVGFVLYLRGLSKRNR